MIIFPLLVLMLMLMLMLMILSSVVRSAKDQDELRKRQLILTGVLAIGLLRELADSARALGVTQTKPSRLTIDN